MFTKDDIMEETETVRDMQELQALCAAIAEGKLISSPHPDEQLRNALKHPPERLVLSVQMGEDV